MNSYQRKIQKLETGIEHVHEYQKTGKIVSAKRVYNRELCYAYAEIHILLKDRFNIFLRKNKSNLAKEGLPPCSQARSINFSKLANPSTLT